jgi:hypothetical protein
VSPGRCTDGQSLVIFLVTQEASSNSISHAQIKSHAEIPAAQHEPDPLYRACQKPKCSCKGSSACSRLAPGQCSCFYAAISNFVSMLIRPELFVQHLSLCFKYPCGTCMYRLMHVFALNMLSRVHKRGVRGMRWLNLH